MYPWLYSDGGTAVNQQTYLSSVAIPAQGAARPVRWWTLRKFEKWLDDLVAVAQQRPHVSCPMPEGMEVHWTVKGEAGRITRAPFTIEWLYANHGGTREKSRVVSVSASLKDGSRVSVLSAPGHHSDLSRNSPVWKAVRETMKQVSQEIDCMRRSRASAVDRAVE